MAQTAPRHPPIETQRMPDVLLPPSTDAGFDGVTSDGSTRPRTVGKHFTIGNGVTGRVCQGVPGPPVYFHMFFPRSETDRTPEMELLRTRAGCRSLEVGANRRLRKEGAAIKKGERLQVGDDPVSDFYFGSNVSCQGAELGASDAELWYRVDGVPHRQAFRFEEQAPAPCLAP